MDILGCFLSKLKVEKLEKKKQFRSKIKALGQCHLAENCKAEEVLEYVLNDTDSELSTSPSESESEAVEAGDLPHPA